MKKKNILVRVLSNKKHFRNSWNLIYQDSWDLIKNNPNCKLNLTLDILYNFEMSARTGNLMPKRIISLTGYVFTGLFKGQLYYQNIFSTVS